MANPYAFLLLPNLLNIQPIQRTIVKANTELDSECRC